MNNQLPPRAQQEIRMNNNNPKPRSPQRLIAAEKRQPEWSCSRCTWLNAHDATQCEVCGLKNIANSLRLPNRRAPAPKPPARAYPRLGFAPRRQHSAYPAAPRIPKPNGWSCGMSWCGCRNKASNARCKHCGAPAPFAPRYEQLVPGYENEGDAPVYIYV